MPIPQQLQYILSTSDLYLTPVYILLLFLIVKKLKNKYYSDSPLRVYILPAFFIHVIGCIFLALVYQYYYGYGDTFGYFTGAREIWEAFVKKPKLAFELLFVSRENFSQLALDAAPYGSYTGFAVASSAIVRIAGVVGLFCFGSYLPIALVFGAFSFWGTWLIYITINKHFPHLYKYTALACLFIPSVIIWSSGVSKEAPCMFALGLCFYSFDKMLHKRAIVKHTIYFLIGAMTLLVIKNYIFYTFAIAVLAWVFRSLIFHIQNFVIRFIIRSFVFLSILGFLIYFITIPDNSMYQNFVKGVTMGENLQEMMTSINEIYGGSGYSLPPLNMSVGGLIKSFFLSLNVTLFRPYLWECTNPLMLMSFAESFGTFLLVLIVLFKVGIKRIIRYCNEYPLLFFTLVFTFLLAPMVGFISFNFGTLVRYKIPFLPFLISFLVIIL
ncbi:MAG: hypothetical protein ABIR03_07195, partial [Ginsengibacter sp.]